MAFDRTLATASLTVGTLGQLPPLQQHSIGFLAGYTGRTRETYTADLNTFLVWCADQQVDALAATRAHLDFYIRWMQEVRGLAPSTVARRFTTVAMFYRYLDGEEIIGRNPASHVTRPKVNRAAQKRTYLSALEFAGLLKAAKHIGHTEYAAVQLMGTLGLRVHEVCKADIEDLGGTTGYDYLRVIGKGGVYAEMGLPLEVMWAVRGAVGDRVEGALLLNSWGERLDRKACQRIIDRCRERAGIATKCTPHGLRRTCATVLLDFGTSMRDVQHQLRHADPRTTSVCYDMARKNHAGQASHRLSSVMGNLAG